MYQIVHGSDQILNKAAWSKGSPELWFITNWLWSCFQIEQARTGRNIICNNNAYLFLCWSTFYICLHSFILLAIYVSVSSSLWLWMCSISWYPFLFPVLSWKFKFVHLLSRRLTIFGILQSVNIFSIVFFSSVIVFFYHVISPDIYNVLITNELVA